MQLGLKEELVSKPYIAALFLSVCSVIFLAFFMLLVPITYGDQFTEIVDIKRRTFSEIIEPIIRTYTFPFSGITYIRPLEEVWRFIVFNFFGEDLQSYNRFQVIILALTVFLFLHLNKIRRWTHFLAYSVALSIFLGHHSVHGTWELNLVISNSIILTLTVIAMLIIGRSGSKISQMSAIAIAIVGLFTKEVGILIPLIFIAAWFLRFQGVKTSTAISMVILLSMYMAIRFGGDGLDLYTLANPSENKAVELRGFFSNVLAGPFMFFFAGPTDGDWGQLSQLFERSWTKVQIIASISIFLVYLATLSMCVGKRNDAATLLQENRNMDWRWFYLFIFTLAICSMISFHYIRHRHLAIAVPFLAQSIFVCVNFLCLEIFDRMKNHASQYCRLRTIRTIIYAMAIVFMGNMWAVRTIAGAEFLRQLNGTIRASWIDAYDVFVSRTSEDRAPYLAYFLVDALETPHAVHPDLAPWFLTLIGSHDSVNR